MHDGNTHDNRYNGYTKPGIRQMEELNHFPIASYIPVEVFEEIYLTPRNMVRGHLRSTFGDPTPL